MHTTTIHKIAALVVAVLATFATTIAPSSATVWKVGNTTQPGAGQDVIWVRTANVNPFTGQVQSYQVTLRNGAVFLADNCDTRPSIGMTLDEVREHCP